MTVWSASDFKRYAGAFTVQQSTVEAFPPGADVEFARYGGRDIFIFDTETGERMAIPAETLDLQELGGGSWRLLHSGRMLLEGGPVPTGFRQRDFRPPRSYRLLTRVFRLRPWPEPEWVSLSDLIRRS